MKCLTIKRLGFLAAAAFASATIAGMPAAALAQAATHGPATGSTATANSGAAAKGTPSTNTADQFKDEASAKSHCPSDTVVWANTSSKAYHMSGTKYYGHTKKGAYMCQKDANTDGFHGVGSKKAAAKKAS